MILKTDAEISAYMNQTRMAILSKLRDGPATATHIAAALSVHPANLTRHIRILQNAGLIELVESRDTGRNLEKYYDAVAYSFTVTADAQSLKAPHKIALEFLMSDMCAAIAELPDNGVLPVYALLQNARIPTKKIAVFHKAMDNLVKSFEDADSPDAVSYHLNLSLYPALSGQESGEKIILRQEE